MRNASPFSPTKTVGWNWTNSHVADLRSGPPRERYPLSRGALGIGGSSVKGARPAGGQYGGGSENPHVASASLVVAPHPVAPVPVGDQVGRGGELERRYRSASSDEGDQKLHHLLSRGIAPGVKNPSLGMAALETQQKTPVVGIEPHAEIHQVGNPLLSLLHQDLHRPLVAKPPSRLHRVLAVGDGRIARVDRGRYAALGPVGIALDERLLGDDGAAAERGGADGRVETREGLPPR